ncbi:MAG: hypothetical protein ABI967_08835 [bacterium]
MTVQEYANQVKAQLGTSWLPVIYRERILSMRTRSYHFGALRSTRVEIQQTLLGVELKVGRRRLLCPDLATARYLSIFARAGCTDIAVPYDITKVSLMADELESSWQRMLLIADRNAAAESQRLRSRVSGMLIANVRAEISAAGGGTPVPAFKQNTKQRS